MMTKKKLLFVTNGMVIGGSTTSLLSILNQLDYSKYDVDLALYLKTGEWLDKIPKSVSNIFEIRKYIDKKEEYIHRLLSPKYMYHFCVSKIIDHRDKVGMHGAQYLEYKDAEFLNKIDQEYDVAIAFLEGFSCKYVARYITAKKKIAWIHVNYIDSKFNPKYDAESMKAFKRIVLVSDDCNISFNKCFPELQKRTVVIENILSNKHVQRMAEDTIDFFADNTKTNLVTTCRITFESKALDRALAAFNRAKQSTERFNLRWYIIGDGSDYDFLRILIKNNNLQDDIILLGKKSNPFPYLKKMDMFFLPSKREGKPMAVTEAFMMGLPALVTEFSSAREQVRDGVDGMIVDNSEQGVYEGLLKIIEHPEIIEDLKKNVLQTDYSNVEEMKKIEALIEG